MPAPRRQVKMVEACTVIKIPRNSWSAEKYVSGEDHRAQRRLKSAQTFQTSSTLHASQRGDGKAIEALSEVSSEVQTDGPNSTRAIFPQLAESKPQSEAKAVEERVEKESVV